MKASHVALVGIIIAISVAALATSFPLKLLWVLSNSYDFEPTSNENPFGLNATVSYRGEGDKSCQQQDCSSEGHFVLSYRSEKPVEVISYNLCGGLYCVLRQGISSYGQVGTTAHPAWGDDIVIKNMPWTIGDTIDIRLKVIPVGLSKGGIVPEWENGLFVDLGNARIRGPG